MIIVPMEESTFLIPVHSIVCGIKVQDEFLRGNSIRRYELFDE